MTGSETATCSSMILNQSGFAVLQSTFIRTRTSWGQSWVMAPTLCSTPRKVTIEPLEMLYTSIHLTGFANHFECNSAYNDATTLLCGTGASACCHPVPLGFPPMRFSDHVPSSTTLATAHTFPSGFYEMHPGALKVASLCGFLYDTHHFRRFVQRVLMSISDSGAHHHKQTSKSKIR